MIFARRKRNQQRIAIAAHRERIGLTVPAEHSLRAPLSSLPVPDSTGERITAAELADQDNAPAPVINTVVVGVAQRLVIGLGCDERSALAMASIVVAFVDREHGSVDNGCVLCWPRGGHAHRGPHIQRFGSVFPR